MMNINKEKSEPSPSCKPEPEDTSDMEYWGNDWYPKES